MPVYHLWKYISSSEENIRQLSRDLGYVSTKSVKLLSVRSVLEQVLNAADL